MHLSNYMFIKSPVIICFSIKGKWERPNFQGKSAHESFVAVITFKPTKCKLHLLQHRLSSKEFLMRDVLSPSIKPFTLKQNCLTNKKPCYNLSNQKLQCH